MGPMKVKLFFSTGEMDQYVADIILRDLKAKRDLNLCAATGKSPLGTYQALARAYDGNSELFSEMRLIKLDEWVGLPKDHPASCEHYLQEQLLQPLQIPNDRYIGFDPDTKNPQGECTRMESLLEEGDPIDLCILGLGLNGHLGLIEPTDTLDPHCQVSELSAETKNHAMLKDLEPKPGFGMTLGMKNILGSKKIILLVNGNGKQKPYGELLTRKVSTQFPISFLWLHPNVECALLDWKAPN